jgi:hypothetical protein
MDLLSQAWLDDALMSHLPQWRGPEPAPAALLNAALQAQTQQAPSLATDLAGYISQPALPLCAGPGQPAEPARAEPLPPLGLGGACPALAAAAQGPQAPSLRQQHPQHQQHQQQHPGDPGECLLSYIDQLCFQEYCCLACELPRCLRPRLMELAIRDLAACIFMG